MFIDSSAFLAILMADPAANDLLSRLQASRRKPVTTTTTRPQVIMTMAESRAQGRAIAPEDVQLATDAYDELLKLLECAEIMVTTKISRLAVETAAIYGVGAGHPAQLTMADCMAYAGAKSSGMPLLHASKHLAETDLA